MHVIMVISGYVSLNLRENRQKSRTKYINTNYFGASQINVITINVIGSCIACIGN